jgi:DNA invertase Pin-like site-specific DNA recombinase
MLPHHAQARRVLLPPQTATAFDAGSDAVPADTVVPRSDRPKLAKALAHAKTIGVTVVFAKLDRLTRNVGLLRSLVASDVDLVFCDLPHVPPGAMGRFLLTQMASVAELEAGLISERTKAALAAAKAPLCAKSRHRHLQVAYT